MLLRCALVRSALLLTAGLAVAGLAACSATEEQPVSTAQRNGIPEHLRDCVASRLGALSDDASMSAAIQACEFRHSLGLKPQATSGVVSSGDPATDRDASLPSRLVGAPARFAPDDPPPGDDATFDELWVRCGEGDALSCDTLFDLAPTASDYELFAFSCGGRDNVDCGSLLGGDGGGPALATELTPQSPAPGVDAELDVWWADCAGGSAAACAQMTLVAPAGSDYATFGLTCGGRTLGHCAALLGDDGPPPALDGKSPTARAPGDDEYLDTLWERCADRSAVACAALVTHGPPNSDYGTFGASCGWRAVAPCEWLFAQLDTDDPQVPGDESAG